MKGKEVHFRAFYKIKMVGNYVLMYKMPLPEEQTMILRRADKEIDHCIDAIRFHFRTSFHSSIGFGAVSKIAYSFIKTNVGRRNFLQRIPASDADSARPFAP